MENYIVRIYRRDGADPSKLVGVCESVEQETRDTFKSLGTLMSLLAPATGVEDGIAVVEDGIPESPSKKISLAD
jgi:hypothetical protein